MVPPKEIQVEKLSLRPRERTFNDRSHKVNISGCLDIVSVLCRKGVPGVPNGHGTAVGTENGFLGYQRGLREWLVQENAL